jgi:hypothetical protein
MFFSQRLKLWCVIAGALTLSACAWHYADDHIGGREASEKRVIVVEAPAPSQAELKVEIDPCQEAVSFTVVRFNEDQRTARKVACDTGRILKEAREKVSEATVRTFRAQNLPLDAWFILVDPAKPFRNLPDTINNDLLISLNKRFSLRYHQRTPEKGLIVYRFEELGFE